MRLDNVTSYLGPAWTRTREIMKSMLGSDIMLLNRMNDSLLSNSGKMLRPMLCLLSASACSGGPALPEDSCRFAAAAEMLHNATLFHDDVVDDAFERRGYPTVQALFGQQAAVLLGDFWLVKAMESILSADRFTERAIRIFAKALSDIAGGEILQLEKSGTADTTEADYDRIIYSKTATLFEASTVSGALSVDAPAAFVEAMRTYAVFLGKAFQIRDDMMDYGDGGDIGKPVGADLREQKITLPLLGALAALPEADAAAVRRQVCNIFEHPEYEASIRALVLEKNGLDYARKRMDAYIDHAIGALAVLPPSQGRTYLEQLARYVGEREV